MSGTVDKYSNTTNYKSVNVDKKDETLCLPILQHYLALTSLTDQAWISCDVALKVQNIYIFYIKTGSLWKHKHGISRKCYFIIVVK